MTDIRQYYSFRVTVSLLIALIAGCFWMQVFFPSIQGTLHPLPYAVIATLLLPWAVYWQYRLYRQNTRKLLFLLEAIENNDYSILFNDKCNRLVSRALNRVTSILANEKKNAAQQEKYYELILECISNGILVLNDNGAVYQKNDETLRLLGVDIFTHVSQLSHIDRQLADHIGNCHAGDKFQLFFNNSRQQEVNLSVRVSDITIHNEHLRILALSDIRNELNEKEIESWIQLIRVLTHEIMNAITPITSLSETLLKLVQKEGAHAENGTHHELYNGLETIHTTGQGLLNFVESYRKFTRIPTPIPALFDVEPFIGRMIKLAEHLHPQSGILFETCVTPGNLILYADEQLVSQVVINILRNAIQAFESDTSPKDIPHRKVIRIRAYCNPSESVIIEISNNGPLIPKEIATHLFIPFFTTKEGGSGIGLSISRQIMRLSGGSITLQTKPLTTFILQFD